MQSDIWAEFKEKNGWNVHKVKGLYVYEHSLPLSRNFLYLPEISIDDEGEISFALKLIFKPEIFSFEE